MVDVPEWRVCIHFGSFIDSQISRGRLTRDFTDIPADPKLCDNMFRVEIEECQAIFLIIAHLNSGARSEGGAPIAAVGGSGLLHSVMRE